MRTTRVTKEILKHFIIRDRMAIIVDSLSFQDDLSLENKIKLKTSWQKMKEADAWLKDHNVPIDKGDLFVSPIINQLMSIYGELYESAKDKNDIDSIVEELGNKKLYVHY